MEETNIVYGLDPLIPLPKDQSLGSLILSKLKEHGNGICLIDGHTGQKVTFRWMLEKTIRAAESLKSMGLIKNDVISVCSENNLNFFVPVIAATYLGIIVAPLNHNYTQQEILHAINISKPKLIFCNSSLVAKITKLRKNAPYLKHLITMESDVKMHSVENFEEFLNRSPPVQDPEAYNSVIDCDPKEQTLLIMSSSGTTGLPKGVMSTHFSWLINLSYLEDPRFNYIPNEDENQTYLGLLPFFHTYGFMITLSSFIRGFQVVVLKQFEERLFLQTIQDYKISSLMAVPPILVFLAKSPLVDQYDLSSIKEIRSAGAPLSKETQEAVQKRLNVETIRQGYGLTETLTLAMIPLQFLLGKNKIGSSGILIPHIKCKVADLDTGKALGSNQSGELCMKGPGMMKGYAGNSEATIATFDEDGWLHTGDVGYYDEDKYFYIVDRIKELIKYKGFQVAPAELETILLTNPNIKDAAVIGIPDERAGELPLAFVVKQPGKDITASQVQTFVAGQVSRHKQLHGGVIFIDEIPKNASGKILRRKLREAFKQNSKL